MLNEKQVSVLTEEELGKWERVFRFQSTGESYVICWLIASHRILNSRNANLVHENDELMAENVKLKSALTDISQVEYSNWYDDANYMKNIAISTLEELNHDQPIPNNQ